MHRVHQQTLFGELDFDKHSIRYGCGWGRQHRLSGGPLVSRAAATAVVAASFNWRTLRKRVLLMMLTAVVVVEDSSLCVREVGGQSSLKADCLKKQFLHPFYLLLAPSFTMQRRCNDIHIHRSCMKRQGCHLVIQPSSHPAIQPASQPASKQACQPARQPASKPTSKQASQPSKQPA
ncbi:hypothetical protein M0802_009725 [Mischocyttarus mexicanus]|nr:hypothetical protein M0802_009725 [Mischocyttarus mexicanus]